MNFLTFKDALHKQFQMMQQHQLYVVTPPAVNGVQPSAKETLYTTYQGAFPAGSNEVFRQRPRHDCQCCKSFIRTVGNVVAIIDGQLVTIWDVQIPGDPVYQQVADAMAALMRQWTIGDEFKHYAPQAGTDFNFEDMDGTSHKWDHLYTTIAPQHVMPEDDIPTYLGKQRGLRDVFIRGLETLPASTFDVVIDLLANGSLYRGEEREANLLAFKTMVEEYQVQDAKTLWAYVKFKTVHPGLAKIRNTAMGTLLVDIAEGVDLEEAVRKYEKIMAPENYKRTSAVVTESMKKKAQQFVDDNGLESALYRRHAMPTDITVNNVLFANRKAVSQIEGSVFDAIETASGKQDFSKVESVSIDDFLTKILPKAESVELLLENSHFGKLMSLTAPVYPDAKPILQWDNNFAWSYRGEFTDAIKERVKNAGGVVEADFCARLAWNNTDDLDLYLVEPDGTQICFSSKISRFTNGQLDVDMNAPRSNKVRNPVENIFYKSRAQMRDGAYHLAVNQYQRRETVDYGFEVNLDFMGQVYKFNYDKRMDSGTTVSVAQFHMSKGEMKILQSLPYQEQSSTEWGVTSHKWTPVNMVLLSPNHWDDQAKGNKHWFFVLDGCVNPDAVRGFYNEFLRPEFHEHRKTFEVLGAKIRAPYSDQQMSGVGFSSTVRAEVLAKVSGAFNRVIRIKF